MRPPSTLLQLNAILVLFCAAAMLFTNMADGQQDTLGLGGFPVCAKGEVDLPSGYELVNDKDKFDEYCEGAKVKPCNVDFDKDGNIEVFYDDLASTKGCTVDLLVNKTDQIEFVAKVEDKERNCITKKNIDNLLPFIFNEANNRLTTLTEGPQYGVGEFCADKKKCKDDHNDNCIKRTMFAIGWELESGLIKGHLRQVGEPMDEWSLEVKSADEATLDVKMAVGDVPDDKPLVTIIFEQKSVEFPGRGNPVCNHPRKATPPPAIWKVNSEEFKDKYFVTFHFFPQESIGADGPKCKGPKQPSFVFSKDFALGILAISKPQTTTTKITIGSTTATSRNESTTATEIKSTTTTPGNESTTPNGTTSSTPPPSPETTEAGGLSAAAIVGIVAGSVLVVAIIVVVAVVVYFLCCRNGKDAANSEDDEHLEEAEDAENAGGDDSANSWR